MLLQRAFEVCAGVNVPAEVVLLVSMLRALVLLVNQKEVSVVGIQRGALDRALFPWRVVHKIFGVPAIAHSTAGADATSISATISCLLTEVVAVRLVSLRMEAFALKRHAPTDDANTAYSIDMSDRVASKLHHTRVSASCDDPCLGGARRFRETLLDQ